MKKAYRIKKKREIDDLYAKKDSTGNRYFVLYKQPNHETYNHIRYAISIGTKYGKAVERNKIKRQLRAIVAAHAPKLGAHDVLIVVRGLASSLSFNEMEKMMVKMFNKHSLWKGDKT